jgi:hypothetical protein
VWLDDELDVAVSISILMVPDWLGGPYQRIEEDAVGDAILCSCWIHLCTCWWKRKPFFGEFVALGEQRSCMLALVGQRYRHGGAHEQSKLNRLARISQNKFEIID